MESRTNTSTLVRTTETFGPELVLVELCFPLLFTMVVGLTLGKEESERTTVVHRGEM